MVKTIDKKTFLNNLGLFVCTREKVLYNFKSRLFPIKDLDKSSTCEPTFQPRCKQHLKQNKNKATKAKTKSKISSLKLYEEVLNKTKNEAKKI